jgi:hypothetical protein
MLVMRNADRALLRRIGNDANSKLYPGGGGYIDLEESRKCAIAKEAAGM